MIEGMTQPAVEVPPTALSQRILRGLSHEAFGSMAVAPGEVTYSLYDVRNSATAPAAGAEEYVTVPLRDCPRTRSLLYQGAVFVAVQPVPQAARNLALRAVTSPDAAVIVTVTCSLHVVPLAGSDALVEIVRVPRPSSAPLLSRRR